MNVKPWDMQLLLGAESGLICYFNQDDEIDMKALKASVDIIKKDDLLWGAYKNFPVGFGIKKLQEVCYRK
jgi:hypothetical protein